MKVKQLDHLNLTVGNFDETVDFYGRVFGFELVEEAVRDGVRWGVIRSGEALLCIYEHPEMRLPDNDTRRERGLHGINHFAFRITDRKAFEATIEREGLKLYYDGMIRWSHSDSWYIKDPTGYEIEVAAWDGDQVEFDPPAAASAGKSASGG